MPASLLGRDRELGEVRRLLAAGTPAAVVVGLPGAGKTSILTAVAGDRRLVITATCAPGDQQIPFGLLADLISSARGPADLLDRVAASHPPDPLRLRLDVLSWLESIGPALLIVDDAQWGDDSSLSVIGYLARRLSGLDVAILAAARDGELPEHLTRIPAVRLSPLGEPDANRLLREAGLTLDRATSAKVLETAAGNPLALLELGRAAAAGDTLPSSVELAFAQRLAALPAPTRETLLLAAAGDGDLRVLSRIEEPDVLLARLAPAEIAGLVSVAGRTVSFRHPLARAAAHSIATTEERTRAHRRLAAALVDDPERRVRHLAEATIVADEEVAAALEEIAARAYQRGANTEAAGAYVKAAELSPDCTDRERRSLQAVVTASAGGLFAWAIELARPLRDRADDPSTRALASHTMAYAMAQTSRQHEARRALREALEQLLNHDKHWGWASLTTLAVLTFRSGSGVHELREWLDRYERAGHRADTYPEITVACRAWVRALVDPLARPADIVELVRTAPVPDFPASMTAEHEMMLGAAAWILDESGAALARLGRSIDLRRADAPAKTVNSLMTIAQVHIDVGDYDAGDQAGRMLTEIAAAGRHPYAVEHGLELRARVAALRGQAGAAREMADRILRDLEIGEFASVERNLQVTRSYLAFAERDAQGAWEALRSLFDERGEPVHTHISYRELAHYVSTGVRAGLLDELRPVVALAADRLSTASPRLRLQLARSRALLAGDEAEPFHRFATTAAGAAQWPFELSRAHLEYGGWLRRRQRPTDARTELQAALAGFERLDARPWAELAATELRAAGGATAAPQPSAWTELTGQEREVVRLAAAGMTNREIGASLFLSPRTVSTHLYNAFPKLGVTARSQLRDRIAGL
ncbi:helix-turn-helix transcriptional regulator [Actinoplanes sp. CA-015351]|uniref:helix-turn-helix transcriptional regulator n=1 Tax=Actinoplanes sp. CA-015351 TaxID=3239897 RepID=UPI003D985257